MVDYALDEASLATPPGVAFRDYGTDYLRLSYATGAPAIEEVASVGGILDGLR